MLQTSERSATATLELRRQFLLRELALVEEEINQVEQERAMLEEALSNLRREQRWAA